MKIAHFKHVVFTLILFTLSLVAVSDEGEHTNVLLIITDQQRWDTLSYAGNRVLTTPNIDKLASQGVYFANAYTQSAVCAPARASILTGHTVEHTGIATNRHTYYAPEVGLLPMPTMDEILSNEHGYVSEYHGKWHAFTSRAKVYKNPVRTVGNGKSVFGPNGQMLLYLDYLDQQFPARALGAGELQDPATKRAYIPSPMDRQYGVASADTSRGEERLQPDLHGVSAIPQEHSVTAFQARQAMAALERRKDQPFSITVSFHFPHSPILPPASYLEMFDVDEMPLPASIGDDMQNSPYKTTNMRHKLPEYADPEKVKYMTAAYYALVKELDDWIGKILKKLDDLALTDNTLVILTSDHGEMLGAHGMREKNVFYEESAHVPLIMRLPGKIRANTRVDGYVSNMDIFPTVMDYLEVGQYAADGKSLRELISGTDTTHGQFVVTEWDYRGDKEPNYMIVEDGWKLLLPYSKESNVLNALYDLNSDPHEMHNLLGNNPTRALHQEKAEQLKENLLRWLHQTNSRHYEGVHSRSLL